MILIHSQLFSVLILNWFIVSSLKNSKYKENPFKPSNIEILNIPIPIPKLRFSETEREEESDFKVYQRLICI